MCMSRTADQIRSDALSLSASASERASLAHDLILSLQDPADLVLSPEQETEIRRRVQMVREGKAAGRPADEIFAEIRAKHSK